MGNVRQLWGNDGAMYEEEAGNGVMILEIDRDRLTEECKEMKIRRATDGQMDREGKRQQQ